MIEVATLGSCRRLYELSGWEYYRHANQDVSLEWHRDAPDTEAYVPEYDLAYLLDKLYEVKTGLTIYHVHSTMRWEAFYAGKFFEYGTDTQHWDTQADTPTEAACLLACKLFEEGILKHD